MKHIGFLLLAGGFVIAAYSTALDTVATNWNLFMPAALAGIVGVIFIKRQASGEAMIACATICGDLPMPGKVWFTFSGCRHMRT